jgi:hypothetical protein
MTWQGATESGSVTRERGYIHVQLNKNKTCCTGNVDIKVREEGKVR